MNRLVVLARLRRCSALGWDCVAEVACDVALWAFSRSREATECAEVYELRSDALEEAYGPL